MAVINTRSLNANGYKLKDCIVELDLDIIGITESWLPMDDTIANHIIGNSCPAGYKMVHQPRTSNAEVELP